MKKLDTTGLRRLPRCSYKKYHLYFQRMEIIENGMTYPRCSASKCHDHKTEKVCCRSVCEAELCPEGWR
jgi:hypothetical protein